MRVYLFGSKDCDKCRRMQRCLLKADISYFYFDVEDPHRQDWYDQMGIDFLPHIQIRSNEDKMLYNLPNCEDPRIVIAALNKVKMQKLGD